MRKEFYLPYFENKKVTVMGLGVLGRGVGDTAFLAACGTELTVTDMKGREDLSTSLEALLSYPNIVYHLGGHTVSDFEDKDFILKASGVPIESEYISHAVERDIPVYMSAALLVSIVKEQLKNVTIIGVTGTRGKSTTTYLIHHLLTHAGKRAHLGGNVRGVANLPLLAEIEDEDFLVLELDSWQLQGFRDLHISPNIAVFTSFLDDHMNYYHNDKEAYFNDKAPIFLFQKEMDVLIVSPQAHTELAKRGFGKDAVVPEIIVPPSQLIGDHNRVSIALACEVGKQCGIPIEVLHEGVSTFTPAQGRLQPLGEYRGVKVYNDNNATTPDAVVAAVKAINETYQIKPIVILGGSDKGLDLTLLEETMRSDTKAYILLAGTGTDLLALPKDNVCETLEACIAKAFELASFGDVILFSPGFASFSTYFKNEYERNDAFVDALKQYKREG